VSADGTRFLDHPSDIGIEAHGLTCAEAFGCAASALISIILDPATVVPSVRRTITLHASDSEQMLVRWLSEILYLYDGEGFVTAKFDLSLCTPTALEASIAGELFDPLKHTVRTDVKAITYHQVAVIQNDAGWHVRAFVDI
jgi:SHS2 domain-containing protein